MKKKKKKKAKHFVYLTDRAGEGGGGRIKLKKTTIILSTITRYAVTDGVWLMEIPLYCCVLQRTVL